MFPLKPVCAKVNPSEVHLFYSRVTRSAYVGVCVCVMATHWLLGGWLPLE